MLFDSILPTVEPPSILALVLAHLAIALSTKFMSYAKFFVISPVFTTSSPGVDSISRSHILCPSVRSNSSSVKNLSWACKEVVVHIYNRPFSSVAQSYPTLCDPMNHSTPCLPVHHQLPESTQTHVHRVGDAIQPSHPLSSPSSPASNLSQHQGLFKWVGSSHEVAKGLEFQLQHQSFQWTPRTDLL